jgi:plasmid stabilization system protein ParE
MRLRYTDRALNDLESAFEWYEIQRRFLFSIFYTIEQDEIIIHSVFDNRQDTPKRPQ